MIVFSLCVIPHLLSYLLAWKLCCLPLTAFLSHPSLCRHWLRFTFVHLATVGQDGASRASVNPAEWQDRVHTILWHDRMHGKTHTHTLDVHIVSLRFTCTLSLETMSQREGSACFHSNKSTCRTSFSCLNPLLKSRVHGSEGCTFMCVRFNYDTCKRASGFAFKCVCFPCIVALACN